MRCLPLAALLAACTVQLEPDVVDRLTTTGGCGDVVIFARTEDDTILLKATADQEIVDAVTEDHQPHDFFVEFPSTKISVTLETGTHLTGTTCTDVVVDPPHVTATWVPLSGIATIRVRPPSNGEALPRADLVLDQVELTEQHGHGDPIRLEAFRILDVLVGWYAG